MNPKLKLKLKPRPVRLAFAPIPTPEAIVAKATAYLAAIKRPDLATATKWDTSESYENCMDAYYSIPTGDRPSYDMLPRWLDDDNPTGALVLDGTICLAPGLGTVETILDTTLTTHWYVYTYRMRYNYPHEPDELCTQPLCDSQSFDHALQLAIQEVIANELACASESINFNQEDIPQ